jgi:hypothetical protein
MNANGVVLIAGFLRLPGLAAGGCKRNQVPSVPTPDFQDTDRPFARKVAFECRHEFFFSKAPSGLALVESILFIDIHIYRERVNACTGDLVEMF